MHKRALVALAFAEESGFPNDTLLKVEQVDGENANPYERLATDLRGEVAPNLMSRVVRRLDETAPAWQANTLNAREIAMSTIREITAKAAAPAKLPPADTHVKDGAALNKDQPRSISPAPAEASEPLLLEEFSEILHEVRLSKRELQSPYRALLKYRDEQSRSWEDIRARVRRFADSLSQPPLSSDLFHGGSENRAVAHRLPKTPGEWEKD
jgi:hypothetical protein